jgi:hypothetical protein
VDKVYLETTRNAQLATESDVATMKKSFADRGIKTSGGLGLTANEPNHFQSYCYSTPADRDKVKAMTEFTARNFDEIILDDFFFSNCKCDRCIAAKGAKSWTQFRTEQMDEVSRDLIIGPARAVNPKVKIIIKDPNRYESSQGLGYDLAVQPKLFDAIYTGAETRDANSGQRLQSYQSYLQTAYFNNIKPGGNQGEDAATPGATARPPLNCRYLRTPSGSSRRRDSEANASAPKRMPSRRAQSHGRAKQLKIADAKPELAPSPTSSPGSIPPGCAKDCRFARPSPSLGSRLSQSSSPSLLPSSRTGSRLPNKPWLS